MGDEDFNDVPVIATAVSNAFQLLLVQKKLTTPVLHAISRAMLVSLNTSFQPMVRYAYLLFELNVKKERKRLKEGEEWEKK